MCWMMMMMLVFEKLKKTCNIFLFDSVIMVPESDIKSVFFGVEFTESGKIKKLVSLRRNFEIKLYQDQKLIIDKFMDTISGEKRMSKMTINMMDRAQYSQSI